MGGGEKGTVTSLDSLFAPGETQKAARRVEDTIADRRSELGRLQGFLADNSALISLIQRLPDELSHDIMVPFGGAAFFPGRLIHTNEFLVLLGEAYYAERTAKQTVEILQRRGKALESQVESLMATMLDLEAKAKFFKSTADEAAEGLVEIREEYIEETTERLSESGMLDSACQGSSEADNQKLLDEDAEHARIMARLAELEKEELEAGSASGSEENEDLEAGSDENEEVDAGSDSGGDEDEDIEADLGFFTSQNYVNDHKYETSESKGPVQRSRGQEMFERTAARQIGGSFEQRLTDQCSIEDLNIQFADKAVSAKSNIEQANVTQNLRSLPTDLKENKSSVSRLEDSSEYAVSQASNISSSGHRAFTGSIVERIHDLPPVQSTKSTTPDQPSGSNPSKPVSRFKMQKGNR